MSDTVQSNTGQNAESEAGAGEASPQELLLAGAVLPVGTPDAGERATQLTARSYTHPGLDGRTVVRLAAAELGPAEDAAAGFLGLEPAGEPAVVGLGVRQSLGFPEWVLVNHPKDGRHALAVVPELERVARQAKSKPKAALDTYQALAKQLAEAVPHFLPTFYEQAGRVFLGVENATYAAQMFSRARAADAEFGLPVDEDRLDSVLLEFALAGALPVKVLAGYGRELAARLPAAEALDRFTRLCIRRTAGGMTPSAQMATELRKLAKAAGSDADAVEQQYLAELLGLSATLHAPTGWWKTHRPALIALARQDPAVRRMLLDVTPSGRDQALAETWLDLVLESGAAEALYDPETPGEQRPAGGTVGWLRRFQKLRETVWYRERGRLPKLYPLVEKCAPILREELAQEAAAAPDEPAPRPGARRGRPGPARVAGTLGDPGDVDLLDLLLTLGVPIADPDEGQTLRLDQWSDGEGQRDLVALAADQRFRRAFHDGVLRYGRNSDGMRALIMLSTSPGGRVMLAESVATLATAFAAVGLPDLPDAIEQLSWLPGEALALAEEAVRAAVRTALAPTLVRTLRAGLFDELGWPDWDQVVADLAPPKAVQNIRIADAWPYLIVSGAGQVRVLGTEGTVLTHDLRTAGDAWGEPSLRYVDGELLVFWHSRSTGDRSLRGYWHNSADRVLPITSSSGAFSRTMNYYTSLSVSLPLAGGGRTTGGDAPLHRGDTAVPVERHILSDGKSYWVFIDPEGERSQSRRYEWREFDPATGQTGRASIPAVLNEMWRATPSGTTSPRFTLQPAPTDQAGPAARPVGGLYGWCAALLPDRSMQGTDLSGLTVTVPYRSEQLARALMFPGADKPSALMHGHYTLTIIDPDGVATSTIRTDARSTDFARGTQLLPPVEYWHCMQPRDPEGSAALRRIDDETAAALFEGVRKRSTTEDMRARVAALGQGAGGQSTATDPWERVVAQVRAVLPQVTDESLLAGISGVVQYTANQQSALDTVAEKLEKALAAYREQTPEPIGPADELLNEPLRSLGADRQYWGRPQNAVEDPTFREIRLIGAARQDPGEPLQPGALHLEGRVLPSPESGWWVPMLDTWSALAYRAASPATVPQTAAGLHTLLHEYEASGLAVAPADSPWRLATLRVPTKLISDTYGSRANGSMYNILPLADGAFLAFIHVAYSDQNYDFTALHYDPTGRFAVPAPYDSRNVRTFGEDRPGGWLAAFLKECAERGPAPWFPEAAQEFADLTGVTPTQARLIVAGLPNLEGDGRGFLSPDVRKLIGVKTPDAATARGTIKRVASKTRRQVLAALLPDDPARLWTQGPDVAAAAGVWNSLVGRRVAVPEPLLAEAVRSGSGSWHAANAIPALLDPAGSPELTNDLVSGIAGDRVARMESDTTGFTETVLTGAVATAAWMAHRLPAGSPLRAPLPAALEAVRARLAFPKLLLSLGSFADLPAFRKAAGTPTEVGENFERYGAVLMATHDNRPMPAVWIALLDEAGQDPYLPALRERAQDPYPVIAALRVARDPAFARLLADPGDPAAGERDRDGTWSPQDPSRSVPDLVVEAAKEYGLGEDAAALYLMLLAMPDPTDRNTARWTGWKAPRMAAARTELAATDLVVEAVRPRSKRSLFLPGAWIDPRSEHLPLEQWKLPLLGGLAGAGGPLLGVLVPAAPAAEVYRRAWERIREGDGPRFVELNVRTTRGRRR
ncbi:MAG TPA: hypothetical protein VGM10_35770 [Actinocrinis sp.]